MARNALTKEGQTAPQRALPRITNIYLLFAKLLQIGGIFYAQKQISLVSWKSKKSLTFAHHEKNWQKDKSARKAL